MLASMSPLGERARGGRWGATVTWFTLGSALGGAGVGALAGGIGEALRPVLDLTPNARLAAFAAAAGLGIVLELGPRRLSYPTVHRQVNEDWLQRYRRWVYAVGFGLQLGFGIATIVTTFAVYLVVVAAALSQSVAIGAALGLAFGLLRGLTILPVAGIHSPMELARVDGRLDRLDLLSRRLAIGLQAALGGILPVIILVAN